MEDVVSVEKEKKVYVKKNSWKEFQHTGLLLFINQILHVFGWAIVLEFDEQIKDSIIDVYPARVGFRGFDADRVSNSYVKISEYLKENIDDLLKEAKE